MAPAPDTPVTLALSLSRMVVATVGVAGLTVTCSVVSLRAVLAGAFWVLPA
jgi:hypothetical protein